MVTGIDWCSGRSASLGGNVSRLDPAAVLAPSGHAIECRIYAENPDEGFMPSPGRISALRVPSGPGVRDDSGAEAGADVPIFYDPMLSKLIAWGVDRPQAIARMRRALREYEVGGIRTTIPFFRWMFDQPEFLSASFHTSYLDEACARARRAICARDERWSMCGDCGCDYRRAGSRLRSPSVVGQESRALRLRNSLRTR